MYHPKVKNKKNTCTSCKLQTLQHSCLPLIIDLTLKKALSVPK